MYQYTEFDKSFVRSRAAQFRDQIERWQSGKLSEDDFRPLRLQNGWYVQRHAPMLRVAIPYGELSSRQLRMLARIAREYDEPEAEVYRLASEGFDANMQSRVRGPVGLAIGASTPSEIALSIAAEIIAVLRSAPAGSRS